MTQRTVSDYIALDWYDQPLLEIAQVTFTDHAPMVQVRTLCTLQENEDDQSPRPPLRGTADAEVPWTRSVIRLTREDLQAMIDLLDGKPVRGFFDR